MAEELHPAAAHHLPVFITAPGETDVLMVVMAIVLGLSVLGFGILYFRLHALPAGRHRPLRSPGSDRESGGPHYWLM